MVQRSVEFIPGPPRDRIVMLPPHMDKSKSQPQHPISAELPLPRKSQHFQAYGLGDSQEIALANHLSATYIIAYESHESEFLPRSAPVDATIRTLKA